jgi:8-oxo-dGTP pyrophosphatase MutT (NUDIX family)
MTIPFSMIQQTVTAYQQRYPKEDLQVLHEALEKSGHSITRRSNVPGHITTSAMIVNPHNQVLLIKHLLLKKWLLPGGHCEEIDDSLVGASLRETREETSIPASTLKPIFSTNVPIDIDIHPIPANPQKREKSHWHADFRYAYRLESEHTVTLQENEVTHFSWLPVDQLPTSRLVKKMKDLLLEE